MRSNARIYTFAFARAEKSHSDGPLERMLCRDAQSDFRYYGRTRQLGAHSRNDLCSQEAIHTSMFIDGRNACLRIKPKRLTVQQAKGCGQQQLPASRLNLHPIRLRDALSALDFEQPKTIAPQKCVNRRAFTDDSIVSRTFLIFLQTTHRYHSHHDGKREAAPRLPNLRRRSHSARGLFSSPP